MFKRSSISFNAKTFIKTKTNKQTKKNIKRILIIFMNPLNSRKLNIQSFKALKVWKSHFPTESLSISSTKVRKGGGIKLFFPWQFVSRPKLGQTKDWAQSTCVENRLQFMPLQIEGNPRSPLTTAQIFSWMYTEFPLEGVLNEKY